MRKTPSRRLLAQSPFTLFPELAPACRLPSRYQRPFSQSSRRRAGRDENSKTPPKGTRGSPTTTDRLNYPRSSPSLHPKAASGGMLGLADTFSSFLDANNQHRTQAARDRSRLNINTVSSDGTLLGSEEDQKPQEPHRFHIYATRHNTHITVTGPPKCISIKPRSEEERAKFNGGVLISVSSGNIGFKKSGRKHYDSAFQLASYVMSRMQEAGVSADIKRIELFLRGFGAGREAVTKALLGSEGRFLRGKVVKVADSTKLKFGGTRSKKPRRLG